MTSLLDDTSTEEPEIDPNKNYLEEYVGEGRKFKSAEDLAKSKFHADATIELFKRRLDEQAADLIKLREENASKAKLQDLIDQALSSRQQHASNDKPEVKDEVKPLDKQQLDSFITDKFQEFETKKLQQDNFNTVKNKLIERFGKNYQTAVKEQIDTLGISAEDFDAMARKSPAAVIRTLGLDEARSEGFQAPPRTQKMTDTFRPNVEKRTWSYYQRMKLENPTKWNDRSTRIQMQKDAIELGESFRDGDYYS